MFGIQVMSARECLGATFGSWELWILEPRKRDGGDCLGVLVALCWTVLHEATHAMEPVKLMEVHQSCTHRLNVVLNGLKG